MQDGWRRSNKTTLAMLFTAVVPCSSGAADCARFVRGDSNLDGKVDLADALWTLDFLFVTGRWPSCPDAADADDGGSITITDPIATLNFLFASGPEPPPPGALSCGLDETADGLGCYTEDACVLDAAASDFSNFVRFEYDQVPFFGFCEVDRVFRAAIERVDAEYRLEMSILVEGTPAQGECVPAFIDACLVESPLPARTLAPEEAFRVKEAFASLPVFPLADAICECLAIDPCVAPRFRWDGGRAVSGYPCHEPHVSFEDARRLEALLEGLRP